MIVALVIGFLLLFAAPSQAAVVYSNDFSSCAFGSDWDTYEIGSGRIFHTTADDHTGNGGCSVQLVYPQISYPDGSTWNDRGVGNAAKRPYTGGKKNYTRYWIKLSTDWISSSISSKLMYGPSNTDSQPIRPPHPAAPGPAGPGCLWVMIGGTVPYFTCQSGLYDFPWGFFALGWDEEQGYANSGIPIPKGQWTCLESYVDLGTVGVSNGEMWARLNGQLIEHRTGLPMQPQDTVGTFSLMSFYQERGAGDIWYDDLVITDGEVTGCGGSFPNPPPPPPPMPPPPPPPPPSVPTPDGTMLLHVSGDNPRYLAKPNGDIVFLSGNYSARDFATNVYGGIFPSDFSKVYTDMAPYRGNLLRIFPDQHDAAASSHNTVVPRIWNRSGSCCANDGGNKWDLTSYNVGNLDSPDVNSSAYFERLRARAWAARQNGIYFAVTLFNGWNWDQRWASDPWAYDPLNLDNNVNGIDGDQDNDGDGAEVTNTSSPTYATQLAYIDQVLYALRDMDNVLYEVCNECYDDAASTNWARSIIDYVHAQEIASSYLRHPVIFSAVMPDPFNPSTGDLTEYLNSNAEVITPNGLAENSAPTIHSGVTKVWLADQDHIDPCGLGEGDDNWPWKAFTRGQNLWFLYVHCTGGQLAEPSAVEDAIMRQMAYVRNYADRINLKNAFPNNTTSQCSSAFCLVGQTEVLGYLQNGGNFTSNRFASGTWDCEWFDPNSGGVGSCGTFTSTGLGQNRTFTNPIGGEAVFFAKRQSIVTPPPPPPPSVPPPPPPPPPVVLPPNKPANLRVQ